MPWLAISMRALLAVVPLTVNGITRLVPLALSPPESLRLPCIIRLWNLSVVLLVEVSMILLVVWILKAWGLLLASRQSLPAVALCMLQALHGSVLVVARVAQVLVLLPYVAASAVMVLFGLCYLLLMRIPRVEWPAMANLTLLRLGRLLGVLSRLSFVSVLDVRSLPLDPAIRMLLWKILLAMGLFARLCILLVPMANVMEVLSVLQFLGVLDLMT